MADGIRTLIQKLDETGQLKRVEGADWNIEIGAISNLMDEHPGFALLFDKVKDYPEGYRLVSNILDTTFAQRFIYNIPQGLSNIEVIRYWKDKWSTYKPAPSAEVKTGPVMENVITGDNINILKFPVPKYHELDGGRYIGTGVVTITRDPDEGWINCGTYRVMVHDGKTLGFYVSPGKHANLMRQKYWAKGENCPVVMCFGQDPALFDMSNTKLQWGMSELDMLGYLKGEPVEVIKGHVTGLPIPATAEIVIEGFSPPPELDSRTEGPFGEWTGYYASGARTEPVVYIKAIYHRDNPIIHAHPVSRASSFWYPPPLHTSASLWNRLERAGSQGIQAVWMHGYGYRTTPVISIKQGHLGHAKEVATLAASLTTGGAFAGKFTIVVDDDVDPTSWNDVWWAICTRCNPENQIDLTKGFLTSPLDPCVPPDKRAKGDFTQTKVIIDACKPYQWFKEFSLECKVSDEMKKRTMEKWNHLFTER
ncbi:UbiD family decarboxylase [Chloroflexota bacterium]